MQTTLFKRILQFTVFTVFIGRGFQHFFRDAPLRVFFYDEKRISPIARFFGVSWENFLSEQTESNIIFLIKIIGILYFLAAFSVFLLEKNQKWLQKTAFSICFLATLNLFFLAFCYMEDKFFHLGQFFEFSIQIGAPLLLLFHQKISDERFILSLKIISALTFICHGLYAMNFYTTPVDYVTMMMNGFHLEESQAKHFLWYAGIGDLVVAILVFLPKISKIALIYMLIWGFLTTMARVYGNWHEGLGAESFNQYWFHSLYRFGHFLVPLSILIGNKNQ
jgi:hypothetical protein